MTNLAKPEVGMLIRSKRKGSIYRIARTECWEVLLEPYWPGHGSRTTWKSRARLWKDYYRIDETAAIGEQR